MQCTHDVSILIGLVVIVDVCCVIRWHVEVGRSYEGAKAEDESGRKISRDGPVD